MAGRGGVKRGVKGWDEVGLGDDKCEETGRGWCWGWEEGGA